MWLPWKWGVVVSVAAWLGAAVLKRALDANRFAPHHRSQIETVRAVLRESAVVMALYSLWQVAGSWSVMGVSDAVERARWVVRVERFVPLPSELAVQRVILPYPWLVKAANTYYAVAHVPALVATLIWGFFRHRNRYTELRNALALTTLCCLVVQLLPLAPPRMLDDLGFVDTATVYDQSVYSALGRGMAGQLAAMPSVHVAWAAIVMWFALAVPARRTEKALCIGHCTATFFVVVATANHFWLDGIVACWLFALALTSVRFVRRRARAVTLPHASRQFRPGRESLPDVATAWQASSDRLPREN